MFYIELIYFLKKALTVLFWVLVIFGFDEVGVAILTIMSALIHELGHIVCIRYICKRKNTLSGDISGFRISVAGLSYKEEIIVALGGPGANLLAGILLYVLSFQGNSLGFFHTFAMLNFMTMISNLLPIENYDGYNALFALTSLFSKDHTRCQSVLIALSFFFSTLLCLLSLYFMLKTGDGYWIFALFFSTVISNIVRWQKRSNL